MFKSVTSLDNPVTVCITGQLKTIDIPGKEPIETKIPFIQIFNREGEDITDLVSDSDYARFEREAMEKGEYVYKHV